MRIRKALAAAAVGTALAAGLALPTQAAAAPATQTAPAATVIGEMVFYDDFWTQSECRRVGREGQKSGRWSAYSCQKSLWDWDLYVDYN